MTIKHEPTTYGFWYGAAKVERFTANDKTGAVVLGITTPKGQVQVYVTKTGKIRVFRTGYGEMREPAPKEATT